MKLSDATPPRYLPVTIVNHLKGSRVELDREAIESRGLLHVKVWEPNSQTTINYQGVRFSEFVRAVAGDEALRVRATSFQGLLLNFSIGELLETPYILVTREENVPLSLASRGPLRLVVEQDELGAKENKHLAPNWLWQIVRLDIFGAQ